MNGSKIRLLSLAPNENDCYQVFLSIYFSFFSYKKILLPWIISNHIKLNFPYLLKKPPFKFNSKKILNLLYLYIERLSWNYNNTFFIILRCVLFKVVLVFDRDNNLNYKNNKNSSCFSTITFINVFERDWDNNWIYNNNFFIILTHSI